METNCFFSCGISGSVSGGLRGGDGSGGCLAARPAGFLSHGSSLPDESERAGNRSDGEEETPSPDDIHRGAARAARGHLRQDPLPGRSAQGTARSPGRPQGGENRGEPGTHSADQSNRTFPKVPRDFRHSAEPAGRINNSSPANTPLRRRVLFLGRTPRILAGHRRECPKFELTNCFLFQSQPAAPVMTARGYRVPERDFCRSTVRRAARFVINLFVTEPTLLSSTNNSSP